MGELRGRAARMEPIRDLADLEPVLASLTAKGLVIPLTRKGRGQAVTHALFSSSELDRLKARYSAAAAEPPPARADDEPFTESFPGPTHATGPSTASGAADGRTADVLQRAIGELRAQMAQVQSDLAELADAHEKTQDEVRRLRDELGG